MHNQNIQGMKTEPKLTNITTEYSKFNANQVLTEKQLNAFIDYFDDQDRLSRVNLNGVGIVCGFEFTANYTDDTSTVNSITITQGTAVTTDGDLIKFVDLIKEHIPSKIFSYFKKFEDDKAEYPHFLNSQKNPFDLWELHATNDTSFKPLSEFKNIDQMAIVLYLEQYEKIDKLCNKLTCDNQGIEQISNLRVLLINADDLHFILNKDTLYTQHNWYEINKNLPVVAAKRALLTEKNTDTSENLKNYFDEIIEDEITIKNLIKGYEQIFEKLGKPLLSIKLASIFSTPTKTPGFQYKYDLLKDLIATYNEIKEVLLHANVNCCPDIRVFPKHIALGRITTAETSELLRHRFYKSATSSESKKVQELQSLIMRANLLVNNYISLKKSDAIIITPSQAHTNLSKKAIPFYYDVTSTLVKNWNFDKTINCRENQNLSYHKNNLSKALPIQDPLAYTICENDFYRIEGHQGKTYDKALKKIQEDRRKYGLSFDIKTLSINSRLKDININKYACEFEDLSTLLKAWRAEQNCILAEVSKTLSSFKLNDPKANTIVDAVIKVKDVAEIEKELEVKKEVAKKYEEVEIYKSFVKGSENYGIPYEAYSYAKPNIVKENLAKEEDTLGYVIGGVFEEDKAATANDIIARLNKQLRDVRESDTWKKEEALSEFILTDISETLVYTYDLDDKIPNTIRDINDGLLDNYRVTIAQLCERVKRLQAKYNSTSLKSTTKQLLGLLINQLSIICCSGKKLETLLDEIKTRKQNILKKTLFSEFVKTHPGLEHKAGVIPGGTFVMVYATEDVTDEDTFNDVVLDIIFREQPIPQKGDSIGDIVRDDFFRRRSETEALFGNIEDDFKSNRGVLKLWDERVSTQFVFISREFSNFRKADFLKEDIVLVGKNLGETVSNFTAFLNRTWERAGQSKIIKAEETLFYRDGSVGMRITIKNRFVPKNEYFLQIFNPKVLETNKPLFFEGSVVKPGDTTATNTVIADFSLPYMCCSDCTPVNFIIPKEPPFLSLPEKTICLQKDVEITPMVFTVRPINGEIKANVPEGVESGVFIDPIDNKTKIDVRKMDKSLLSKKVGFTVNDEPTDCELIVYPELALVVTIEQPIEYNEDKTRARVTFVLNWEDTSLVNASFFNNIQYRWDFNGDGTFIEKKPTNNKLIRYYDLPINDTDNTVIPKLEISLGPCARVLEVEPVVFDRLLPSTLEIQPSYCLDTRVDKIVRIPFKNISGVITLVTAINGIEIEGNELVIDATIFNDFEKAIEFLEGGQTTNARITIHEVKQISIVERTESRFVWKDGQLMYEGAFEAVLPNGVKPVGLSYDWSVDDQKGTSELFNPAFLIKEGADNSFTIQLTIKDINGCSASAEFTKEIAFPDFTIIVEDEFCLEETKPSTIMVNPDYEGVQITGGNVKFNADKNIWEFTPSTSGLIDAGNVTFSIVGTFVSKTVKINRRSKADFTYSFDPVKRVLTLTNTSETGQEYIWNVQGKETVHVRKVSFTQDLSDFDGNEVKVSLTVNSPCGADSKTVIIDISTDEKPCEDQISTVLNNEQELFEDEESSLGLEVVDSTKKWYTYVIKNLTNFTKGTKNNELVSSPSDDLLSLKQLIENTAEEIKKEPRNEVLIKYYRAQVKLFFSILHCQAPTILESDRNFKIIQGILDDLKTDIAEFDERDIKIDTDNGDLRTFLEKCAKAIQAKYIQDFITNELIKVNPR